MPNTKSAIRRVRRVKKQTQINRIRRSKYKHAIKQMDLLLKSKDKAKAKTFFSKFQSILMQVAKSGVINKKTAARKIKFLKNNEIKEIIKNTKIILSKSIKLGGASIKDFSSSNGKKGSFQQHFKAYAREGEKCSNIDCKEKIKRIIISNRSSFYCSSCQK